ncbi:MAG: hypothetical protein KC613_00840 [Myxococcales bacterium]|nr:hypothetical protein [Myxococcales bacterium]MCB9524485.1 hypothetical protein [Myxococcales bacterium]
MTRGLPGLLAACALASCSLVVSDIELPPADGLDAAPDAATVDGGDLAVDAGDAGRPDMADAWIPDTGPDMADAELDAGDVEPPDMADAWVADMAPDQGVPTLDVRALAGRWRVYGVLGDRGLADHQLEVGVLGAARWAEVPGEWQPAALEATGARPQVALTLPWDEVPLTGALDPRTGVGVLAGPRAVLFLSRIQIPAPEALVTAAYYAHAAFPAFAGEFGVMGELPDGAGYIEASRRTLAGGEPSDVRLALTADGDRWQLTNVMAGAGRILSPIKGRRGAVGLIEGNQAGARTPVGLALVWNSAAAPSVPTGEWLCAGLVGEGEAAVARQRLASIDANGRLTWDNGARAQLESTDTAVRMVADRDPFFDRDVAFLLPGPEGRVMALFNRDDTAGTVGYGFGLCVALGLPDPVE